VEKNITNKIIDASKWSAITELIAKLISPVLNMVLARLLAPEAFGVLATVTMVISFAEVFVESGFQKYLVQHSFADELDERRHMSVALWANMAASVLLWGIIILFDAPIAALVGSPGKGHLLIIAGVAVPLYGIIGIQGSKLRKDLDFKKLFYVRIAAALVPLVVTIPLALLGLDYWALVIGYIAGIVVNCLVLVIVKSFKPMLFFSWSMLKEMLSVGIWTMLNGVTVWLSNWFDAFLIGQYLSEYYLGLYKNSTNIIISIFTMITAAFTPVLFSSLSKLQEDQPMFKKVYLGIERLLALGLIPLGVGLLLYQNFAVDILLGSQWTEAAAIVGITSVTTALRTVFISLNGDVFRAKGYFKVPLMLQVLDLIVTLPVCYFALQRDFWTFLHVRSLMKLFLAVPEMFFLKKLCGISPLDIGKNVWPYFICSGIMSLVAIGLRTVADTFVWNVFSVVLCATVYLGSLLILPRERETVKTLLKKIQKK